MPTPADRPTVADTDDLVLLPATPPATGTGPRPGPRPGTPPSPAATPGPPAYPTHGTGPTRPWWAAASTAPLLHRTQVTRSSRRGRWGTAAAATVLAAALAAVAVTGQPNPVSATPYGYSHAASINALVGGCSARTEVTRPDPIPDQTVPATTADGSPTRSAAPWTDVPVRGAMHPDPVPPGVTFWAPDDPTAPHPRTVLRSLWDGWMVVYYTADVHPDDLAAIRELATTRPDLKLLAVPWPRRAGVFTGKRTLAFAAWGNAQYCVRLVASALAEFRAAVPADAAPGAGGAAPPARTP